MKYKIRKVLKIIEEIDKALELLTPLAREETKGGPSMVATPVYYAHHVLTNTRNFLNKEGGE